MAQMSKPRPTLCPKCFHLKKRNYPIKQNFYWDLGSTIVEFPSELREKNGPSYLDSTHVLHSVLDRGNNI